MNNHLSLYGRFLLQIASNPRQYKHLFRWFQSTQKDYLLQYKQPWLTFDATDFLNALDLKDKQVFEYGSGGSTLFWLSKGAECVSVEHNKLWYDNIKNITNDSQRLDYRLVEAEAIANPTNMDYSDPDNYLSSEYIEHKVHYKTYVQQIDIFQDEFFDVILIDGRARPSCIKHSISKVKVGGYLVLDNSEREYYISKNNLLLNSFIHQPFKGITPSSASMSTTSIYKKLSR